MTPTCVSVYPVFESWDIGGLSRVRAAPLRETRFALDVHLGKLARLLRMVGFDAQYSNTIADEELARLARGEKRIILSRDRGLLKRRTVTHGYLVRSDAPRRQLAEVAAEVRPGRAAFACSADAWSAIFPSRASTRPRSRPLLPEVVALTYNDFSRCAGCGRVFWRGTHWERMKALAAEVLGSDLGSSD